jgi:hypothetical protein
VTATPSFYLKVGEIKNAWTILFRKPNRKRPYGISRLRRKNNIKKS